MTRFPEQKLWDRIRRNLGREIHIERIENSVAAGMPDTVVLHKGAVTFVEHKVATLPMRKTTRLQWKHPLSADQCNWHRTWTQNGGTSYIVVGVGMIFFAIHGKLVDGVTRMTEEDIMHYKVNTTDLARVYKGARR